MLNSDSDAVPIDRTQFSLYPYIRSVGGRRIRIMTDESREHRDPSPGPSGQPARDGEVNEVGRGSNRRRIIGTGLLAPPVVMTLNARRAAAQSALTPSMKFPNKYK